MRYFLDTEYNGWGGALLSLALAPESGEDLYLTLDWEGTLEPWVELNVVPYLDTVPDSLVSPRMSRADAARTISHYLAGDPEPVIVADWPDDIAYFCKALLTGNLKYQGGEIAYDDLKKERAALVKRSVESVSQCNLTWRGVRRRSVIGWANSFGEEASPRKH